MEHGIAGQVSAHLAVKAARGDAVWPFLFTGLCIQCKRTVIPPLRFTT